MKSDIRNSGHIEDMVKRFYEKVFDDDLLGPIFKNVAKVDLEQHLPVMNKFWGMLLLGQKEYQGDPFEAHRELNDLTTLDQPMFDRWNSLFCRTVDELYDGPTAERAKAMAASISDGLLMKFGEQG